MTRPPTAPFGPGHVVVTGGCGFIGSNIVDALARAGHDVVVLDNLSRSGAHDNAEWLTRRHAGRLTIAVCDIADRESVRHAVTGSRAVLHLAAQVAVTTSIQDPTLDFETNLKGTFTLLEAVRLHAPRAAFLFASTNKVYGDVVPAGMLRRDATRYSPAEASVETGIGETAALDFHSPYGCSKGAADQYVRDYARIYGLTTIVLRMSCIYGPRQFGNEDQGWLAHVMMRAIRGDRITIFGDGCQVRDALYVDDAVAAWLSLLDHAGAAAGRVFNLGGGVANTISLRELLTAISDMQGVRPDTTYTEWRPGDQRWYVSDISAITAATGWRPTVELRDGLARLRLWLVSRLSAALRQPERVEA